MPVRKSVGFYHGETAVVHLIPFWRAKVIHFTADLGMAILFCTFATVLHATYYGNNSLIAEAENHCYRNASKA